MSESTARSGRSRQALPSILLKETPVDPTIFDRRDPLEKFLDNKKQTFKQHNKQITAEAAYDDDDISLPDGVASAKKPNIAGMSLNEYLTKYTSEDNQSFQTLHD